jgi:hypothetical protein
MTTVRVLVDSVGPYNAGDIVKDAPAGLVHMAKVGTVNAATGQRIAELIENDNDDKDELKQLKARAKELKVDGYGKMSVADLKEAIATAEKEIADAVELNELQAKAAELKIPDAEKLSRDELMAEITLAERMKELHGKAAELQIADFVKMSPDELVAAIEAVGGGKGAQ